MPASGNISSRRSVKCPNSRASSLPSSSMRGSAAAKSVVGWRFAPACCAAQSVCLARRRSAVLRSAAACPRTIQFQGQVFWSSASRRRRNAALQFGCCTGCFATRARPAGPPRQRTPTMLQLHPSPGKPVAQFTAGKSIGFKVPALASRRQCWLTIRSTGPIAAGRHLGYKSLAQMPACRNGPVTSNVRRQNTHPHSACATVTSQGRRWFVHTIDDVLLYPKTDSSASAQS